MLFVAWFPWRQAEQSPNMVAAIAPVITGVGISQKPIRGPLVETDGERAIFWGMAGPRCQNLAAGNFPAESACNGAQISPHDHLGTMRGMTLQP